MRLLVVGDVMIDETRFVSPLRVSQEDPGCIVYAETEFTRSPGGAGHAAALCRKYGANVQLEGNDPRLIIKYRYMDRNGRQLMRVDREQQAPAIDVAKAVEKARNNISAFGHCLVEALLVSDYAKGTIREEIPRVAPWIVVNGKPQNYRLYRNADVVQYNWAEASAAGLAAVHSDEVRLRKNHFSCHLVITAGDRGMYWLPEGAPEGTDFHIPAVKVPCVRSVVGAGDVVAATIACAGKLDIEVLQLAARRAAEHIST